MKVRIKFAKTGHMKFVGHLDTMRYFQKAIRRAELPVAFSGGYSPHMIMSFAAPLGVGTTSLGEYFDMELTDTVPTKEIEERLNAVMADGVSVCSARQVEDGKASTAMALVAAADYFVQFREGKEPAASWRDKLDGFLAQKEIIVTIFMRCISMAKAFSCSSLPQVPTTPNLNLSWIHSFDGWARNRFRSHI